MTDGQARWTGNKQKEREGERGGQHARKAADQSIESCWPDSAFLRGRLMVKKTFA